MSQQRSFYGKRYEYIRTCPTLNSFQDIAISLYSYKPVANEDTTYCSQHQYLLFKCERWYSLPSITYSLKFHCQHQCTVQVTVVHWKAYHGQGILQEQQWHYHSISGNHSCASGSGTVHWRLFTTAHMYIIHYFA
jgi:hypothetical protein